MGWKDDLQDASFRGVPFECTTTTENGSKNSGLPWSLQDQAS